MTPIFTCDKEITKRCLRLAYGDETVSGVKKFNFLRHLYLLLRSHANAEDEAGQAVIHVNINEVYKVISKYSDRGFQHIYISSQWLKKGVVSEREFSKLIEMGHRPALVTNGRAIHHRHGYEVTNAERNIFSIHNLVIDLDFHGYSAAETDAYIQTLKDNIEEILEDANIPMPNFIHYTPHGCQLWWCMEEVPYTSFRGMFLVIYNEIVRLLNRELENYALSLDGLQVDPQFHCFGLVRLPGTGRDLTLYSEKLYSIIELKDALGLKIEAATEKKTKKKKKKVEHRTSYTTGTYYSSFSSCAQKRIAVLLQYLRTHADDMEGQRDTFMTILGSTYAVLLESEAEVLEALLQANQLLAKPLLTREIRATARSVWKRKYRYTTKKIQELLSLSIEEVHTLEGRAENYNERRNLSRKEKRRVAKEERQTKFANHVYNYYVEQAGFSTKKTAEHFDCCENTIRKYLAPFRAKLTQLRLWKQFLEERRLVLAAHRTRKTPLKLTKKERAIVDRYRALEHQIRYEEKDLWQQIQHIYEHFYYSLPSAVLRQLYEALLARGYRCSFMDVWIAINYRVSLQELCTLEI